MDQSNAILISVTQPQLDNTDPLAFVTYQVSGSDAKGQFQIRRRFRDFYELREKLVDRFPGLYIPPVASKKATGNTQNRFVEKRKQFLNYFLTRITNRRYLYYSEVFQMFIRGNSQFDKQLKTLNPISFVTLLEIYQKQFSPILQTITSAEVQKNTETQFDLMKKAQKKLDKLREQCRQVTHLRKQLHDQYNLCQQKVLPQYEENFVLKHFNDDRNKLIISGNQQFEAKLTNYQLYARNSAFENYQEIISYELKQIRSFIEAIKTRQDSETRKQKLQTKRRQSKEELEKLKQGKTTLKSIFTKGDKDLQIKQLQQNIPKWEAEEQSLGKMIDLMNASIYQEIANYKSSRGIEYPNSLKDTAKKIMKEMSVYAELIKIPIDIVEG